jgi:SAM-dependent methyltransferase
MAKWILKAVVQKGISYLPYKQELNFFFQKYITRGVALTDAHFVYKLEAARDHLRFYTRFGTVPLAEARVLELGTGWYPIVPAILYLAGCNAIESIDIRNWLTVERQLTAYRKILEYYDSGRLSPYLANPQSDRIGLLRELCRSPSPRSAGISERVGLRTTIMDATALTYADDTFDLICSNNTFEHIHAPVLREILREFKRVLKPRGVMSHFVDLSDHFAHLDGSITIYHFLRFSEGQWRWIDNDIQPQNRLRWPDYRAVYAELGIAIRAEEVRAGDLQALATVPVHPQFAARLTAEELAVSHGYLVS